MIMTEKEVKEYLLTLPEVLEDYPFKLDISVFKIEGKMFALL
ncbi:MAG: putative DNA-binding protein (MmcQ/YjbR family), partial [Francisellaceae bacterium]